MSKYGSKYQIQFTNQERDNLTPAAFVGVTVDIGIYDRSNIVDDSVTQTVFSLTPSGDPFHLSSVDNSEDKFTPIRAIQATFQFLSDDNFTLETFTDSPVIGTDPGDPRWYVEVIVNSKMVFKGFLVLDDCFCAFMPTPNVVTLVATDGLGWLKNIDLSANTFKTFTRGSLTDNGVWSSNLTALNAFTQLFITKKDSSGNDISWVLNLQAGDQVELVKASDNTISAIYNITSFIADFGNYLAWNVTNVSGDSYNTIGGDVFYIRKIGDPLVPMGYYRIADYIAWCLQKTGLTLDLKVVFNIRDESSKQFSSSSHFTASSKTIGVAEPFYFFYAGQRLIITGTASNNQTVTVLTVVSLGFFGTLLTVSETIADEDVIATYQDTKFHFFDKIYLDAKTFEGDDVGTMLNCYDVISRILGDEAFLTQRAGKWWIYRIDETELNVQYNIATFFPDGSFKDFIDNSSLYGHFIQKDLQHIVFSGESTEYTQNSQYKSDQEDYKFELPKEIPCNVDFVRGDFNSNAANEPDENGNDCTVKLYNIDCWTYNKEVPPVVNDSNAYIKRLFNANDYEVQRYIFMPATASNDLYYLKSEFIPLATRDKFNISVSFKWSEDLGGAKPYNVNIVRLRLYGTDGSFWNYGAFFGHPEAWYLSDSAWSTNVANLDFGVETTTDLTDWNSINFDVASLPVAGNLEILLINNANPNGQNMFFTDLQFTYLPYINGSYQKFNGIHFKVSRDINFRATREKQVYISDGIKPLFKGALFVNHGAFILVNRFFNWKAAPVPSEDQIHPYLVIQGYDVWNQFRNVMKTFHGNMQGLSTHVVGGDGELFVPSLIHTFYLQDAHPATYNRRFMLLTFDQDFYTCEWKGTFAEVYRVDIPKSYADTLEVKYD